MRHNVGNEGKTESIGLPAVKVGFTVTQLHVGVAGMGASVLGR